MAIRNNIAKLLARAQVEEDPDVLERIAARIQDALNDKVEHLRGLEAARRSHSEAGSSEQRPESRRTPETDTPSKECSAALPQPGKRLGDGFWRGVKDPKARRIERRVQKDEHRVESFPMVSRSWQLLPRVLPQL
jgi:hypothetical protein